MRLIDADKFKKQIATVIVQENPALHVIEKANDLCNLIDKQPTAYDLDKVVGQLMVTKGNGCPPGYKCKDDESCEECMIRYAIDVVKSVAIDN